MPDHIIEIPGVGNIAFPETMSPEQVNAAAAKLYQEKQGALGITATRADPNAFNPPRFTESLQKATGVGPAVGSTVGAMVGGVPGAAIGGAAGLGYEQIARHAKELPGAVVDVARNLVQQPRATLKGAAEGLAQGVSDVGTATGVGAALEAGGQFAMKGLGNAAEAVYRGYLKPSLATKSIGKAQAIVKTALDEALPITSEGAAKAQRLISQINGQVKSILAKTPGTADLVDIADQVRIWAAKQFYRPGVASSDYEAALKVADSIDRHAALNLPPGAIPSRIEVPLAAAQEVKQGLQAGARAAYGTQSNAATTAYKVGASATRQAIEAKAPVGALNAQEGRLIDTARAIARAVEREKNQYVMTGTKSMVAGLLGGEEYSRTGDPFSAAAKALAVRAALTPQVASRLAIIASRIGKLPGIAPASAARLALAAISEQEQ